MPKDIINSLLLVCNIWIEGKNILELVEVFHPRGLLTSALSPFSTRNGNTTLDADGRLGANLIGSARLYSVCTGMIASIIIIAGRAGP